MAQTTPPQRSDPVAILFAQIGGGTVGAEEVIVDWLAREDVSQRLTTVGDVVKQYGGVVCQKFGEVLMANFADADTAVKAACAIHEALAASRASMMVRLNKPQPPSQIAINFGPVEIKAGAISGDTVNMGFKLLKALRGDTIVVTQPIFDALSESFRKRTRELGKMKAETSEGQWTLYEVRWAEDVAAGRKPVRTTLLKGGKETIHRAAEEPKKVARLRLRFGNQKAEVGPETTSVSFGRDKSNNFVTDPNDKQQSRKHAHVEYKGGQFVLVDHSMNGTFFRSREGEEQSVSNSQIELPAEGKISLGVPFAEQPTEVIEFKVTDER